LLTLFADVRQRWPVEQNPDSITEATAIALLLSRPRYGPRPSH
jgi:hypothetical protein